ncbi:XopAW family type III secretion system calcium-binding effector [Pseudomonas abietaniphila]|uniref:XopAW family type III secretion system calcium-binding effector n=1 Tax=Pseudomonas abietaniphila TaxID=89065 RepID=UPI003217092D
MITGVSGSSSYSSYVSSSSTTSTTNSKKFADELLKKLDTNGDGSIDKDELSSALTSDSKGGITVSLSKAFSDLDSNDDDSLDADELASMTPLPPPPMQTDAGSAADEAQDLLSALDTDGDGNVSSDELTAALSSSDSSADSTQVFDALDTNQDGNVSLDELTASLQTQQPPPPPPAQDSSDLFSSLDSDGDGSITADELTAAMTPDSSRQQQTTTQATEALNRMVAALSDRYNLNSSATAGKYVSTSA